MLGAQITDAPATIKASQRGKGRCLFEPQQGDNQRFIEKGIRSFKEVGGKLGLRLETGKK